MFTKTSRTVSLFHQALLKATILKLLMAALVLPGLSACSPEGAATGLKLPDGAVLEVAVVRIDPARRAEIPALQAAVRGEISKWPGFLHWTSYESTDEPDLVVDLVAWRSQADAAATMELAKNSAVCQKYFTVMKKEVLFHHFRELR